MPVFRSRRITLLILALLLSGLFITAPWKETQPEGAPYPNTIRGPNWGIDITGGSRIMLQLEATQVTLELPEKSGSYANDVLERFRENLETPTRAVGSENVSKTGKLEMEIGKYVSKNVVKSFLKDGEKIVNGSYEKGVVSGSTQDQVKNSLKMRVDPYGTLGAQFKPLGVNNQYLQFEVSLELEEAKKLLGKEGLPEVFVENQRVIWSEHIRNVQKNFQRGKWGVSFNLSSEGKKRFANYTTGKAGHPGVIYLDRPNDAVLLFKEGFEEDMVASTIGLQSASYSKSAHKFRYETQDITETTEVDEGHPFLLQVPAVKIKENKIPTDSKEYIENLKQEGEIDHALLLGKKKNYSENIIKNNKLLLDNTQENLENITQMKNESYIKWLNRVCGLESWPTLQPDVAGKKPEEGLRITTGNEDAAEELRIILSQRLPVEVTHISETEISGRLSEGFIKEAGTAGIIAFIIVGILVYLFYQKFKIAIPLLLTMISEVIITLGAASAVPDGLMSIGLPGIGGLIAVIGTGVDHQIIIADEILGEKFEKSGKLPIDRRTGKAFAIIFSAAATTIAAMLALAFFGFGAMRGFAIITLFGVLISVLITRPAYAQIIGTLLESEQD